jgi:hypothetical protein
LAHPRGLRRDVVRRKKKTVHPILDLLDQTARSTRKQWKASGARLGQSDAKAFDPAPHLA